MYYLFFCISTVKNLLVAIGSRVKEKGSLKDKFLSPIVSDDLLIVRASSRKGDKLHKQNIHCSDGAEYMSYFKVGCCFINCAHNLNELCQGNLMIYPAGSTRLDPSSFLGSVINFQIKCTSTWIYVY